MSNLNIYDSSKSNSLIKNWFRTLLTEKTNDEVLLLRSMDNNIGKQINSLISESTNTKIKYKLIFLEEKKDLIRLKTFKNIIIIINPNTNMLDIFGLKYSFLVVPSKSDFFTNMTSYISTDYIYTDTLILNGERYLYYLDKIEPYTLIDTLSNINAAKYINHILFKSIFSKELLDNIQILTKSTTYSYSSTNDFSNSINGDLHILKLDKILTSRLAVLLYRLSSKDIGANTTKIGRYFNEKTGNKSKVINVKSHKLSSIPLDLLRKKAFKAYDLNVNERELEIRREIAKNILTFNINTLKIDDVAKITGLTEEDVLKLY